MAKPTRAALQAQLADTTRAFNAMRDWFNIAIRHEDPETVFEVTLEDGRTVMYLRIRGMHRPCGGVVVVDQRSDGDIWVNDPQYLDDLISKWSQLTYDPYRREAASQLRRLQKAANDPAPKLTSFAELCAALTVRP